MTYNSIHGNSAEYLTNLFIPAQKIHNYEARHAQHGLHPTHMHHVAGQRSFFNKGCHLWNSLPLTVQHAPTLKCFKKVFSASLKILILLRTFFKQLMLHRNGATLATNMLKIIKFVNTL